MKRKTILVLLFFAGLSSQAIADHPYRDRGLSGQHSWAVEYAETALRQAREARRHGCDFTGNRWSMNYRDHYEWALRQERRKGLVEIDRRNEALNSCRARYASSHGSAYGHANGYRAEGRRANGRRHARTAPVPDYRYLQRLRPDEFARWYADTAVAQSEENRIYGCGNSGGRGRWRGEWDNHYQFARQVSRTVAIREVEIRAEQLSYCGRHG